MKKTIILLLFLTVSINAKEIKDFEKNCNNCNMIACDNLAFMYYQGKLVKQNYTKASSL